MTDPRLIVLLGMLGVAGIIPSGIVVGLGVLMPWAYPRNILGVRSRLGEWLGLLPGVDGRGSPVETAIATVVVLGVGIGMLFGSFLLIPTTSL